jgi:hypothetical protein
MSWQDFYTLIKQQNTDVTAWMAAIEANPNTAENALKDALLEIVQGEDMPMLDKFTALFVGLVRNADALLDAIMEQGGFPVDLTAEPVVVIGQDDPRETYDVRVSDLFNLPDAEDNGPIVSVW